MISKNKWYSWFTVIVVGLTSFLTIYYIAPLTSQATMYLLLLLMITFITWREGFRAGLALLAFSSLITIYSLFLNEILFRNSLVIVNELSTFLVTAILIIYIIEKYKKTDLERRYKRIFYVMDKKIKKLEEQNAGMLEKIKMRDEFLSIASHELKTPLTSMLLKIQILLHNIRNVSLANFSVQNLLDMLETAESQTKRLSQMISDLLNISLITTGRFRLEKQKEDISKIVKEVVKEFSEKLQNDKRPLKLEADTAIYANVDKLRIEQVITNLLSNAIKYGNGKPIEVFVKNLDKTASIAVIDHGIGIEKDQRDKLFKLFERGVSKDTNIKGLGVGLFISNKIVKAHGGEIKVESTPRIGSVFTVYLPI